MPDLKRFLPDDTRRPATPAGPLRPRILIAALASPSDKQITHALPRLPVPPPYLQSTSYHESLDARISHNLRLELGAKLLLFFLSCKIFYGNISFV